MGLLLASISFTNMLLIPTAQGLFGGMAALGTLLCVGLFPAVAWRRAQWTRFELGPHGLFISSGPFGPRELGLSSNGPTMEVSLRSSTWGEPFVTFQAWDLHADRDGLRVHVATIYDEKSLRALDAFLARSSYALQTRGLVAFDPSRSLGPAGTKRATYLPTHTRYEVGCARGKVYLEALLLAGLAFLFTASVASMTALSVGALRGAEHADSPGAGVVLGALLLMLVVVRALGQALRDQLRLTDMRARGRVILELGPDGIDLHTAPWWTRPLGPRDRRLPGRISLVVRRVSHTPGEAFLDIVQCGRSRRLHAPLALQDAHDLVAVVEAHEAAREIARQPVPESDP